jgi:hypothetical protein
MFWAAASETATLSTLFTVNGVPTDPTTVTLVLTDPQGVTTTYTWPTTVTRSSAGAFWASVPTPTAGTWQYTWTGTGTVADVDSGTFSVFAADLGKLYATPAELKSRVGVPATDRSQDLELNQACRAASRAIENYCQRTFWLGPIGEVRVLESRSRTALSFGPFNDLASIAAVSTDLDGDGVFETGWASTDWELSPYGAATAPEPRPYTGLASVTSAAFPWPVWGRRGRIQITGRWGWPAVPAAISEAARILAAELFRLKDAPLGVASYGEAGVARVRRNPNVAELADPYVHPDTIGVLA